MASSYEDSKAALAAALDETAWEAVMSLMEAFAYFAGVRQTVWALQNNTVIDDPAFPWDEEVGDYIQSVSLDFLEHLYPKSEHHPEHNEVRQLTISVGLRAICEGVKEIRERAILEARWEMSKEDEQGEED